MVAAKSSAAARRPAPARPTPTFSQPTAVVVEPAAHGAVKMVDFMSNDTPPTGTFASLSSDIVNDGDENGLDVGVEDADAASALLGGAKRGRKPKYLHTIVLTGINARELYRRYRTSRCVIRPDGDGSALSGGGGGGGSGVFEYTGPNDGGGGGGATTTTLYDPLALISASAGGGGGSSSIDALGDGGGRTELATKRPSNAYLDSKTARQVTFLDYVKYGSLPNRTDLSCWHDHHPFSTSPIGCPIRFVDQSIEKHAIDAPTAVAPGTRVGVNSHYLTIGVFCSFPCVLAYIDRHKHEPMYRDSKSLLYSLYYKLYRAELKIKPAADWQCLKSYGGTMTIEEFRRAFCSSSNYVITADVRRPHMVSVGKYIETRQCGYY